MFFFSFLRDTHSYIGLVSLHSLRAMFLGKAIISRECFSRDGRGRVGERTEVVSSRPTAPTLFWFFQIQVRIIFKLTLLEATRPLSAATARSVRQKPPPECAHRLVPRPRPERSQNPNKRLESVWSGAALAPLPPRAPQPLRARPSWRAPPEAPPRRAPSTAPRRERRTRRVPGRARS